MYKYHLAQLNIAKMLAPLDEPVMEGFVTRLDEINALAEAADGFVWRLQTEDGDATALRVFEDVSIIVNMSVWESIEALYQFTYYSGHVEVFQKRREWFQYMAEAMQVLWWIPAGEIPTIEEAKEKLTQIREKGPTPQAFDFKHRFTIEEMLASIRV